MAIIVDTGAVLATADRTDRDHGAVNRALDTTSDQLTIPVTVLSELDYMVSERLGGRAALEVLRGISRGDMHLETFTPDDFARTIELIAQYSDSDIGFVDASIVAVAERLRITKVLTLDRRHFGMIRPRHCEAFEIIP